MLELLKIENFHKNDFKIDQNKSHCIDSCSTTLSVQVENNFQTDLGDFVAQTFALKTECSVSVFSTLIAYQDIIRLSQFVFLGMKNY